MVSPKTGLELNKHAKLHGVSSAAARIVYEHFYKQIKNSPSKKNNKTIKERAIKKTHDFLRGCIKNTSLVLKIDAKSAGEIQTKKPKC